MTSNETGPGNGTLRRTVLKAGTATLGALGLGMITPVTASSRESTHSSEIEEPDSPVGFGVEILAGHANFPDAVAAEFRTTYDEGDSEAIVSDLPSDASSVIFAKVTWEPEGTSGWHTHPGPVIVSVAEGELRLINERDCVERTYGAGEAFIDPGQGNIHIASNPSTTDTAVAYATFLGVPDGEPATVWVAPADC